MSAMRRRARLWVPAAALSLLLACKSIQPYIPELIAIGGTLIEVAALSYNDGEYAPQVTLLMATLTPAAVAMAAGYMDRQEEEARKEELAQLEEEIEAEYASLDAPFTAPPANAGGGGGGLSWGAPAPAPATPAPAPIVVTSAEESNPTATEPASPWGNLYASKGVGSRGGEPPALEVALLRSTAGGPARAFDDGAVLHDGRDGTAPADTLRVFFRPSRDSYVYVVAIDAAARVQALFPLELPPAGPVPAGADVWLPGPTGGFGLDENRGIQHVYFYASPERQQDLEAQLYRFASRPKPAAGPARVNEPTRVEGEVRARGLTGTGQAVVVDPTGTRATVATTRYLQGAAGGPLVVTRVFEHR
ncbi:MAG: DUF4384 domain-containing protein [Myxococcota bacterium]